MTAPIRVSRELALGVVAGSSGRCLHDTLTFLLDSSGA